MGENHSKYTISREYTGINRNTHHLPGGPSGASLQSIALYRPTIAVIGRPPKSGPTRPRQRRYIPSRKAQRRYELHKGEAICKKGPSESLLGCIS